jgi:hypothetical protein
MKRMTNDKEAKARIKIFTIDTLSEITKGVGVDDVIK